MRVLILSSLFLLCVGCEAQLQSWQRQRSVDHLSRIKSYRGHLKSHIAGETFESDIWFQRPDRFLLISKTGEISRSDGYTMETYDPRSQVYSVFKNLPQVSDSDAQKLIADLFDQSMKIFAFSLGPLGKVTQLPVIELRSKPKGNSVVQSAQAQIFDEFSFPLKASINFKDGQTADYEFSKVDFNEDFELPKAKIPKGAYKVEWDFNQRTKENVSGSGPNGLKLEKILKPESGAELKYYRNGAQFLSVVRYRNLGNPPPQRGVAIKVGKQQGFLWPGPLSNVLVVSADGMTCVYTSNLLADDLVTFASHSQAK